MLLVYPDVKGHKLRFEEQLIDRMKDKLWIGSLNAFGTWWSARDRLEIDYDGAILLVSAPTRVDEIEVRFPKRQKQSVVLNGINGRRQITVR